MASPLGAEESLQRDFYDSIAPQYLAHYSDPLTLAYRDRFIHHPMVSGLDVEGANILEAMCGGGDATGFLLKRGARMTGLDVSKSQLDSFRERWPECETVCASVCESGLPDESFDHIVVVGGLHHVHPRVQDALDEFHRVLKPGGCVCFSEPHDTSLLDFPRRLWYRFDGVFMANERSIDLETMKRDNADRFHFEVEDYKGSVGYLLVLNSFVFRVPLWLKRLYAPALMSLEAFFDHFLTKYTACNVICRWRKLP